MPECETHFNIHKISIKKVFQNHIVKVYFEVIYHFQPFYQYDIRYHNVLDRCAISNLLNKIRW